VASLQPSNIEIAAAVIFAIAIVHTFSTKFFARLAHIDTANSGLWHLLSEVEAVFGFWAMVLIVVIAVNSGVAQGVWYLDTRNFTEPLFVFAIMVIAASRPILHLAGLSVRMLAATMPAHRSVSTYFVSLSVVPLLGSFITEPAAMTLGALLLRDAIYKHNVSSRLKYATLGALFVNVSIGGVLTPYAAPPVLMVAAKWGFDFTFMITTFGWRAAIAVFTTAALVTLLFREELRAVPAPRADEARGQMPVAVMAIHLLFLAGVVVFAHHPSVFLALFLFFLGFTEAYKRYQDRLILREGLMVAFFLAGLVTLGGQQKWWLESVLLQLNPTALYYGATALTAVTDNAALTYLGSLVEGVSAEFKYALVAGAVTGGGLTVIANAPNPAGFAILKSYFRDDAISPLGLLLAALGPTLVAIVAFQVGAP
jgi:Na+/H+ antiporter NhaD/arsenite permease-like protein